LGRTSGASGGSPSAGAGKLLLRGPFGAPWPLDACRGRDLVIAAGGIGLAPLRSVLYEVVRDRAQYGRVSLLYGARSPDLLLYRAEMEQWRQNGIDVQVTVDRATPGWEGHVGVVPLLVERLQPLNANEA